MNAAGASNWSSSVNTDLSKLVARGHQHDHTVGYRIAITPVAGYPADLPNPGVIIPSAVAPAASAWTSAGAGAGLAICRHYGAICEVKNADTFIVTVKLSDSADNCGRAIACIRPSYSGLSTHRANMRLIFEEPALAYDEPLGGAQRYRWTNVADDNDEPVSKNPEHIWRYVGPVMVHEFGHTLGLADHLDKLTSPVLGVMSNDSMTITQEEIDYLLKIYSGHVRGE